MSQKKLPTLIATRPVYLRETVYTEGQPYVARTDKEAEEMILEPSWRKATSADLKAWAGRLAKDPAISYLRSLPEVTETEHDEHPEDAAKRKAKADQDDADRIQREAEQKAADDVRAAAAAKAKVEPDSQPGPSGGNTGPVGIG